MSGDNQKEAEEAAAAKEKEGVAIMEDAVKAGSPSTKSLEERQSDSILRSLKAVPRQPVAEHFRSTGPQYSTLPVCDVVFIDSLHLSANIGPDCWDRDRSQPINISVYLHLKESYLDRAGASDNVSDSVDYSDLTKKVSNFIKAKGESETPGFSSLDELINGVIERAFDLAGEAAAAVRVIVGIPKMILLAAGFSVDITTVNDQLKSIAAKQVLIKDLVLPVIIGVNPAERKSKQLVKVNVIFHENTSSSSTTVNYQQVVSQLCQAMESSSYLTLETFVMQILKISCMCSDRIQAVTARAQKPSALSFAESSGVEITRNRNAFVPCF